MSKPDGGPHQGQNVRKKLRSMKALLSEARRLPKKEPYITVYEMGSVIDVLHQKDFTWKEIHMWCSERGHQWSAQSIAKGWRTWSDEGKKKVKRT